MIDIATKKCILDNNQSITLEDLIEKYNFSHPLLQNPYNPSPKHGFKSRNITVLKIENIIGYFILLLLIHFKHLFLTDISSREEYSKKA